jgi:hypothetical protein
VRERSRAREWALRVLYAWETRAGEAPLEHLYSLVADIQGRSISLQPYGVTMTKILARKKGINPVWYVDMTMGRNWVQAKALNELRKEAIANGFVEHPAARLFPFAEPMGTWDATQREFWWEREWRKVGDLRLESHEVAFWLCPEDEISGFEEYITEAWEIDEIAQDKRHKYRQHFVDPRWNVERIVAHLVGRDSATPTTVR